VKAAAALSEHPLATHSVGDVAGSILERLSEPIDLVFVFAHSTHGGIIDDIAGALAQLLDPTVLVGTTASGVIAQDAEVEDRSALAVWAASGLSVAPLRFEPGEGRPTSGWPAVSPENAATPESGPASESGASTAIVLADPFSTKIPEIFHSAATDLPGLAIHGGLVSAARGPGEAILLLDGDRYADGAVGVVIGGEVTSVVSQGCRPVGEPFTVTESSGNLVTGLASRPPLDVLRAVVAKSSDAERELLAAGVHIGLVVAETKHEYRRGDFLIRGLLGFDQESGAMSVGASVPVGTTLQFHVRDAASASLDLREHLAAAQEASAALTFTCNGRGERLFGRSGHDAELVHELTGSGATAGMFCAGEFGPFAGSNHVHGFTSSSVLFTG